jgi:hypothetical protein
MKESVKNSELNRRPSSATLEEDISLARDDVRESERAEEVDEVVAREEETLDETE